MDQGRCTVCHSLNAAVRYFLSQKKARGQRWADDALARKEKLLMAFKEANERTRT